MATFKLKIDLRSKRAKALLDFLFKFAEDDKSIQIEEDADTLIPNKKVIKESSIKR